jgi:cellulose biosynthesis protein BcsQ
VKGLVHLFLEGDPPNKEEGEPLQVALAGPDHLGSYWSGDLWSQIDDKLAKMIRDQRRPAPWEQGSGPDWFVLERHIAKRSWTSRSTEAGPPWPLSAAQPAVVSFFSFKGGVGRTTTAAAVALNLCRNGHRVAIVDFDLEAPGLATLFLGGAGDHTGLIDYLIEKPVQGDAWRLRDCLHQITNQVLIGDEGGSLRLLPAGNIDPDYLEKLARVDVQDLSEGHLGEMLKALLQELAEAVPGGLDFVLLDARAGLHELGGLALTELSHAAVLFGIHGDQSWAGLELVIRRLARPEQDEGLPTILVHALGPPAGQEGAELERKRFLERAYDLFSEQYYRQDEVPAIGDLDQPHVAVVMPWQPLLRSNVSLDPESPERAKAFVALLTSPAYSELTERVCVLTGRSLRRPSNA